jgi:hypothetical protein
MLVSEEEHPRRVKIAEEAIDLFPENALDHSRIGWHRFFELTVLPFTKFNNQYGDFRKCRKRQKK